MPSPARGVPRASESRFKRGITSSRPSLNASNTRIPTQDRARDVHSDDVNPACDGLDWILSLGGEQFWLLS